MYQTSCKKKYGGIKIDYHIDCKQLEKCVNCTKKSCSGLKRIQNMEKGKKEY